MFELLKTLYPLNRTLNSADTSKAYEIVNRHLPTQNKNVVHRFRPGRRAWTWPIPAGYHVNRATLTDSKGTVYADFAKNPLYIWSYSVSTQKTLTWSELEPHLYYNKLQPMGIPWRFKYYEKAWGFSVEYAKFQEMPRNETYEVDIDVEFRTDDDFKILTSYIDNQQDKDFIFCTNICHPYQVNDSISGLVVAVEVANRLARNPVESPNCNFNFLFGPETIGSIVYFAHNEEKLKKSSSGLFVEMVGHKNQDEYVLQQSRDEDAIINKIFQYVLRQKGYSYSLRPFARWNDEGIIDGPGVNIPCPFLMQGRYDPTTRDTDFYEEYHTSLDNPSIISDEKLHAAADIVEEALRIYASNYRPKQRTRGILFLSGLGMHTAFEENPEVCLRLEKIIYMLEGKHSVLDIAFELQSNYWDIKRFIDQLHEKDAIEKIQEVF